MLGAPIPDAKWGGVGRGDSPERPWPSLLEQRLADLRADLYGRAEALRTELAAQRSDLIKWMFLFWVGTIVPLAGLMVALVKL